MPEFEIKLLEGSSGISHGGKNPRGIVHARPPRRQPPAASNARLKRRFARQDVFGNAGFTVRSAFEPTISSTVRKKLSARLRTLLSNDWTVCALRGSDQVGF